jgi:hypothetical protein
VTENALATYCRRDESKAPVVVPLGNLSLESHPVRLAWPAGIIAQCRGDVRVRTPGAFLVVVTGVRNRWLTA